MRYFSAGACVRENVDIAITGTVPLRRWKSPVGDCKKRAQPVCYSIRRRVELSIMTMALTPLSALSPYRLSRVLRLVAAIAASPKHSSPKAPGNGTTVSVTVRVELPEKV